MVKNIFTAFKIIVSIIILWFIIHSIYITIDGCSDDGKNADLAVIYVVKSMKTEHYQIDWKNVLKAELNYTKIIALKRF